MAKFTFHIYLQRHEKIHAESILYRLFIRLPGSELKFPSEMRHSIAHQGHASRARGK
jgi:hypothetical protein